MDQLKNSEMPEAQPGSAARTGSVTGSCPWPGHAFAVAGQFPDNRVPDGWPCLCGQTVARWQKCNMGHDHLVSESPNAEAEPHRPDHDVMSTQATLPPETPAEARAGAVLCSSVLLECLSPKQQYDRAYYLKNRDKKLARARERDNKYQTAITKNCLICGNNFECGGPNAKRSPKAFTCGDACKSAYRSQKNKEYIKANYERVRTIDNETHRKKRKDPTFKESEYEKNRARMKRYRENQDYLAKERARQKPYRAQRVKSGMGKIYYRKNAARLRASTEKSRARKVGAIRLMQMLAIANSVNPK